MRTARSEFGRVRRQLIAGAEQAFDTRLPQITWTRSLAEVVAALPPTASRLALDHYEAATALSQCHLIGDIAPSASAADAVLAFGPERGWSARDRAVLRANGFSLVHSRRARVAHRNRRGRRRRARQGPPTHSLAAGGTTRPAAHRANYSQPLEQLHPSMDNRRAMRTHRTSGAASDSDANSATLKRRFEIRVELEGMREFLGCPGRIARTPPPIANVIMQLDVLGRSRTATSKWIWRRSVVQHGQAPTPD